MAYVSGSTPSAPVTSVKLFISYTLPHVTTATVKNVFDTVFDDEVIQIEELERKDRDTGKSFKLFWVTLAPERHSRVWRFVDEIEKFGKASIIYETRKGKDYYWQVRLNKEKAPATKFTPRIMPREETTSNTATAKERADVIAFSKTPAFSKLVDSIVFEGVIEPKLEPGEIKEKKVKFNVASKAAITVEKDIWLMEDERRERAALKEESSYGKLEEQEAALAEWESNV